MGKKERGRRSKPKALRVPGKHYSEAQEIGRRGQEYFAFVAGRVGLIPIQAQGESDVGIDFICQRRSSFVKGTATVLGDLLAVPVRATTKVDARVLLSRADAAHLLQTQAPVLLALPVFDDERDEHRIYYRPLDESFADELLSFLDSTNDTISYTPKDRGFVTPADAPAVISQLCSPGYAFRIRLHGLTHRARKVLSDARIFVQQQADGEVSLIYSERISHIFDVSKDDLRSRVLDAVFGHSQEVEKRLAALSIRPELLSLGHHLPGPVVFHGSNPAADTTLVVRGPAGTAQLNVEWRDAPGWSGFVHRSGLSLRVSDRTAHEGRHVHFIRMAIDPDHPIDLRQHADVETFLALCREGQEICLTSQEDAGGISVTCCDDLYPLGAFVNARRLADDGLPDAAHTLARIPDAESINALLFWAGAKDRRFPEPWGFSLTEPFAQDAETTDVVLPICANLGSAGVVFWVRADVYFLRHDGKICGLRISRFERAFADQRSRITKATPYPELAVASEWPSVVLGPLDQVGTRDVSSWDVELTLSADLVAEEAPLEQERTSGKDSEAASSSD